MRSPLAVLFAVAAMLLPATLATTSTASFGIVSLSSSASSSNCPQSSTCDYKCAEGFTVTQTGSTLLLSSTYADVAACVCPVGVATLGTKSGNTYTIGSKTQAYGLLGTRSFTISSSQVTSDVTITIAYDAGNCYGTYDIAIGTVLTLDKPVTASILGHEVPVATLFGVTWAFTLVAFFVIAVMACGCCCARRCDRHIYAQVRHHQPLLMPGTTELANVAERGY